MNSKLNAWALKWFERFEYLRFTYVLPDKIYLKIAYYLKMGKKLNLKNPQTFNEKLQWLKLYKRKPEYTMMADKYKVREYIAKELGEEYLIPILGVWESPDDIDFDALPNQFVLKCNHNSGLGMCICKDKSKLDTEKVKEELRQGLKENYYKKGREWVYKDIPRKIIAEKFMVDEQTKELRDYKFYCFNGEPKLLYISKNWNNHEKTRISYLDLDWNKLPFCRIDYKDFEELPEKPLNFEKMIKIAKILAEGTKHLRVDLYEINGQVYFGELTFYTGCGFAKLTPEEWDKTLGDYIGKL